MILPNVIFKYIHIQTAQPIQILKTFIVRNLTNQGRKNKGVCSIQPNLEPS